MELTEAPDVVRATPWQDYTDGQWRLARPGQDYRDPAVFRNTGRRWASRNGYTWESHMTPEGIKFNLAPRGAA